MPAFSSYYPATYPYQQNYFQQPFQQQIQSQPIQQNGIIWVSGDEEAIAYPIAPNNAVRLWHNSQPIVYFKSADASGKPSIKAYDLVERTQNSAEKSEYKDFASKSEFDALSQAVDAIKKDIKALNRKKEAEDDE